MTSSPAESPADSFSIRRVFILLGVCALSGFYLWIALRNVDRDALAEAAGQLRLPLIPIFVSLVLLTLWVRATRIAISLVRDTPVTASEAARPMMAGYVTSLILPQPAGEIARLTTSTRDLGVSPAAATAAIAVERVLDLMLALLLIAVARPFASNTDPRLAGALGVLTIIAAVAAALLTLAMRAPQICRAICEPLFKALPQRIGDWCRHHFEDLLSALNTLTSAHRILRYALLTVLQTALWGSCVAVSLWAAGIPLTVVAVTLTTAMFTLALLLPAAPGYIGSMQLAYVGALVPLGIAQPQAFAASLYAHVLFNVLVLLVGTMILRRGRGIASR